MEILYKRHIVRQRKYKEYHPDEVAEINKQIADSLKSDTEDFYFYNDKYRALTEKGKQILEKLYSEHTPIYFYEFSFSNGEKKIYQEGTFLIE